MVVECDKIDLLTDQNYGHLWQPERNHCQCGLLSKQQITNHVWIPIQQQHTRELVYKNEKIRPSSTLQWPYEAKHVIVDSYLSKLSMYCSALEASESFLSIGSLISLK